MASGAGSMLRDGADGYAPFPDYDARDSYPIRAWNAIRARPADVGAPVVTGAR